MTKKVIKDVNNMIEKFFFIGFGKSSAEHKHEAHALHDAVFENIKQNQIMSRT